MEEVANSHVIRCIEPFDRAEDYSSSALESVNRPLGGRRYGIQEILLDLVQSFDKNVRDVSLP
jgi:hypothetical protein